MLLLASFPRQALPTVKIRFPEWFVPLMVVSQSMTFSMLHLLLIQFSSPVLLDVHFPFWTQTPFSESTSLLEEVAWFPSLQSQHQSRQPA